MCVWGKILSYDLPLENSNAPIDPEKTPKFTGITETDSKNK
jgi:hypothetical protein